MKDIFCAKCPTDSIRTMFLFEQAAANSHPLAHKALVLARQIIDKESCGGPRTIFGSAPEQDELRCVNPGLEKAAEMLSTVLNIPVVAACKEPQREIAIDLSIGEQVIDLRGVSDDLPPRGLEGDQSPIDLEFNPAVN